MGFGLQIPQQTNSEYKPQKYSKIVFLDKLKLNFCLQIIL